MSKNDSAVFPRRFDRELPMAKQADGVWIETQDGKRYLDASGGAVVVNLGHCRGEIADAVYEQLKSLSFVHGTMFSNPATEELATELAGLAPGDIDRFYFMSSGSEAVETAIKLARQIQLARGNPHRSQVIARWKSYHGLTMGALAAAGRTYFREPFYPMMSDAVHISAPYCLRCSFGLKYPECGLRCALALEETIQNVGVDSTCCFIAETVSGASLASCPPPKGYWPLIREICDRYSVVLIMDEVMCGMGRTGRWFAAEHYDTAPDLITLGKGLSGGALPLSAVGVSTAHMELVRQNCGNFAHGGTYSHHTVTCAAGLAAVRIMQRDGLVEQVERMGPVLGEIIQKYLGDSPYVGDIRGIGMMWGVELVKDKHTLTPFPRSEKVTERIWDVLFDKGLILYKSIGMAGIDGDGLMVAPPYIITKDDLEHCAALMAETIQEVLG